MSAFWANYRREQEAKIAAKSPAIDRCAICQQPILSRRLKQARPGTRCPSCIETMSRASPSQRAAIMRNARRQEAQR